MSKKTELVNFFSKKYPYVKQYRFERFNRDNLLEFKNKLETGVSANEIPMLNDLINSTKAEERQSERITKLEMNLVLCREEVAKGKQELNQCLQELGDRDKTINQLKSKVDITNQNEDIHNQWMENGKFAIKELFGVIQKKKLESKITPQTAEIINDFLEEENTEDTTK